MKNALTRLFERKPKDLLSIYLTAGYPAQQSTVPMLKALEKHGVDFVEVGIPFSDPLADGPTIQGSSEQALANGMSLSLLLDQLREAKDDLSLPLVLMGYLNPILQYGERRFLEACRDIGIAGLIIPDLPLPYYREKWQEFCEEIDLPVIFLITPQTSEDRIREIDELSRGFIYMVSTNSLTGQNKSILEQGEYFERITSLNLQAPRMIGFGIHNPQTLQFAQQHANGAIIGSAFIKSLVPDQPEDLQVQQFIETLQS